MDDIFGLDDFFPGESDFLNSDDEAAVVCNDCVGCKNCCRELSAAITLDARDVALLKRGLGKTFDELLENGSIAISERSGLPLPVFGNKPDKKECVFLGDNGRCSIHKWRAGICRMYPLARMWKENNEFSYYLQKGECPNRTGEMMKISAWLEYEDVKLYESAIKAYHGRLKEYRKAYLTAKSKEEKKNIAEEFFNINFRNNNVF